MSLSGMSGWLGSPEWMRDADCKNEPHLPWTTEGWDLTAYEIRAMSRVCAGCPVLATCSGYAVEKSAELWGFWAGQSRSGIDDEHLQRDRTSSVSGWRRTARDVGFEQLRLLEDEAVFRQVVDQAGKGSPARDRSAGAA